MVWAWTMRVGLLHQWPQEEAHHPDFASKPCSSRHTATFTQPRHPRPCPPENNGCRAQVYDSAYICQIGQFDDRVRWLNNSFHAQRTGRGARCVCDAHSLRSDGDGRQGRRWRLRCSRWDGGVVVTSWRRRQGAGAAGIAGSEGLLER